jgi:DNA processing protein
VVATGLDITYPRRHGWLHDQVRANGLLISENGYGTRPNRARFPVRNRIIAALSDVVVVVEATARGGARITAEHALEYDRPVLAIPGSRRNPSAAGCNELLRDGAAPLLDPSDVLVALGMTPGARRAWVAPTLPGLAAAGTPPDAEERAVLNAMGGEPASADQIAERIGIDALDLSVVLDRMTRAGRISRERGYLWPR